MLGTEEQEAEADEENRMPDTEPVADALPKNSDALETAAEPKAPSQKGLRKAIGKGKRTVKNEALDSEEEDGSGSESEEHMEDESLLEEVPVQTEAQVGKVRRQRSVERRKRSESEEENESDFESAEEGKEEIPNLKVPVKSEQRVGGRGRGTGKRKSAARREVSDSDDEEESEIESESEEEAAKGSISKGKKTGTRSGSRLSSKGERKTGKGAGQGSARGGRRRSGVESDEDGKLEASDDSENGGGETSNGNSKSAARKENQAERQRGKNESEDDVESDQSDSEREVEKVVRNKKQAVAALVPSQSRKSSGVIKEAAEGSVHGRKSGENRCSGAGVNRLSARPVKREVIVEEEDGLMRDENASPGHVRKGARRAGTVKVRRSFCPS
jgi:hypothetical protein